MVQESIPLRAQVKHFPIPLRKSLKVIPKKGLPSVVAKAIFLLIKEKDESPPEENLWLNRLSCQT